jgi:hypothetical protein
MLEADFEMLVMAFAMLGMDFVFCECNARQLYF